MMTRVVELQRKRQSVNSVMYVMGNLVQITQAVKQETQ